MAVGPDGAPSAESAAAGAERFGRLARQWAADGAVLIGGCCRTRPDHIAAVARELRAAEEEGRHRQGTTLRPSVRGRERELGHVSHRCEAQEALASF